MAPNTKKYVIAGLDGSGKTSILLSLQGVSNLLSYYALRPTLGLNIEQVLDKQSEISIWELGGQEEYRNTYFEEKKLAQFFEGMKKFIYVLDIQAINRYQESLHYLSLLQSSIINANPEEIIIFFHKFDPNLNSKPEYSEEKIRETLIRPIRKIFVNFTNLLFYKSTIFTVFQKSSII
jgi:hypothetical protein